MKKLKVYVHLVDNVPGFERSADEIVDSLIESKLVEVAEINICHQYSLHGVKFRWLMEKLKPYPNVTFHFGKGFPEDYEIPTLIKLKQDVESSDEDYYILYLHHKGVTKGSSEFADDFRKLMLHFYVRKWEHFVGALDLGYDVAGINWFNGNNMFPGNFWWISSKYAKKLPLLQLPSVVGHKKQLKTTYYEDPWYRCDAEYWIGEAEPIRYYSLRVWPSEFSPEHAPIKPEEYIDIIP